MRIVFIQFACIGVFLLLPGCSDRGSGLSPIKPTGYGSVSFTVNWPEGESTSRVIPPNAVAIEVTVTQNGRQVGQTTIIRPASTGKVQNIPVGNATVSAIAKNSSNLMVAWAWTSVLVIASQTISAHLILHNNGELTINESLQLVTYTPPEDRFTYSVYAYFTNIDTSQTVSALFGYDPNTNSWYLDISSDSTQFNGQAIGTYNMAVWVIFSEDTSTPRLVSADYQLVLNVIGPTYTLANLQGSLMKS